MQCILKDIINIYQKNKLALRKIFYEFYERIGLVRIWYIVCWTEEKAEKKKNILKKSMKTLFSNIFPYFLNVFSFDIFHFHQ